MIAVLALPLDTRLGRDKDVDEAERRREEDLLQQVTLLSNNSPLLTDPAPHVRGGPMSPLALQHTLPDLPSADEEVKNGGSHSRPRTSDDAVDGAPEPKRRRLPSDLSIVTERSLSTGSDTMDASPSFLPSTRASVRDYLRQQQQLEHELLLMKIRREHHSGDDEGRNPINPCGACNEWLKKIAEVNPDFKVITFTSTDCRTCFVKSVKF